MKLIIELGLFVVCIGLVFYARQLRVAQPRPVVTSEGVTVEKLEKLQQLVTNRVSVVDVLIGEGEGCRGVWLIYGDAWLSVDLSKAAIIEKDETTRQATIRLPQPAIMAARVNHEKSKRWEVRTTTWNPWHADQSRLLDEVMLQGQRLVARAAASQENIDQAKRAAEIIIAAVFEHLDWKINVVWQEAPDAHVAEDAEVTEGVWEW